MIPISFSHTLSFFSFVSFIQLVLLASLAAIRGCIPTEICTNRELSSFPTPEKKMRSHVHGLTQSAYRIEQCVSQKN